MPKFNLSIPTPCHEHWEEMTPAEQGRFCSSCQKTVIDFTSMTDQQLAAFFKKPHGGVCGRFAQDQLERDITMPTKRIPWVRYFFQFTLPAFLLSLKAGAQKESRVETVQMNSGTADTTGRETRPEVLPSNSLRGKVIDEKGEPVAFATVVIKGTKLGTVCDKDGSFNLSHQQKVPFVITVSCIGFQPIEHVIMDSVNKEVVLQQMQVVATMGLYIVSSPKKKKPIPIISSAKRDTAFNQFSVYPNPARSNGNLTLDCKKMAKGIYTLQLLTVDGKTAMSKQLELDKKGGLLRTDLPTLTAGQYVLTLRHNASGKVFTEKIQVH